ncbi:MAG TPA: hypothetical protein VD999_03800 [Vitreimonas sp.]|nr:hypothetical protein [Vitreimonas sp.]
MTSLEEQNIKPFNLTDSEQTLHLKDTLAQSVDLSAIKEKLMWVDCDISLFDIQLLKQVLNPELMGITVFSSMDQDAFNKWSKFSSYPDNESLVLISNPEAPQALFEDSASFCSILFSIDESGASVLLHYPVVSDSGALTLTEEMKLQLEDFAKAAMKLSQNRKNVLTSTNVSDKNRNQVLNFIKDCIGEDFHLETIFTQETFENQNDITSTSVQLTKNFINGVLIIPKQLTIDKRTKVFLFTNKTGYTYDQLMETLTRNHFTR